MIDFIQGEKFQRLADNTKIFFCKTGEVNSFLQSPPAEDFILISHNADASVTDYPRRIEDANVNLIPSNLIKWFGQNVDCEHEKVESIPIGLENSQWFPEVRKREKIESKSKEPKKFKNLLYLNHTVSTNVNERIEPYRIFRGESWVTTESGPNGYNFDEYLYNIHSHKFVLSPRGNGIDTHRLWECLYLGTIPIEKRNFNNKFYTDLPICFVDDWKEINPEFLEMEFQRIQNTKWDLEKLQFSYWERRIKGIC